MSRTTPDADYEIITRECLEKDSATTSTEKTIVSMSLQVKAVLLKEGVEDGPKEIRRFRMEEEGSRVGGGQLFQSLLTRLQSVFNVDTSTQQCTLYWKDDDGDLVQCSTEEELMYALDNMRDGTFRVFVTLTEANMKETDQAEASEEGHVNARHVTFDVTPHEHCTNPATVTRLGCPGLTCGQAGKKCGKGACKMGKMMEAGKRKEFQQVRQQVPEEFRSWVRQYVRAWYTQGPDMAQSAPLTEKLPEGVSQDFPHWFHSFLHRHHPFLAPAEGAGKVGMEGEWGEGPEGLPPVYFRWLCLFLPRFHARFSQARAASADSEGEEAGEGQKKGHKGQGKHGCHKKKGGKQGARCVSSESEDSDCGQKPGKKVPKEFRKYARVTVIQLHKNKGDNSENKEKATRAGLSADIQEFVEQILLEWHAKMSSKRPRAVAMEMMGGERTLPEGLEQDHFLWLCRFLARWHRRHAGKCDVMSGWSSGETTTDDTSGEETVPPEQMQDFGPWPSRRRELRAIMKMVKRCPYGMMGPPPPPFAMHAGCPLPACCGPRRGAKWCCRMGGRAQQDGCRRWEEQDGARQGEASGVQDDSVRRVTEGVKKM